MIPFLNLKKQHSSIKKELMIAIEQVIDSGQFILGSSVANFEKSIANYLDVKHAIGVASGSDALLLSLMALDIGPGDEVITTPFTFFATAGSIARLGAKPVFVDIDKKTYNIDPNLIEQAITPKTKAIMPVHIFGQCADMTKINGIAKKHNLKVIEDACQSIGAEWEGKKAGALGDLATFSFFPTKNLGALGDAGLITTNDDALADYLRKARVHGSEKKYHHAFVGVNSRLDALQAAVLQVKIDHLDTWNEQREVVAKKYDDALKDVFVTPFIDEKAKSVYHQYALLAKDEEERKKVMGVLKEAGVASGIYYPVPLHLQECFADLGYKKGDLPVVEDVSNKVFSIPLFPSVPFQKIIDVLIERS